MPISPSSFAGDGKAIQYFTATAAGVWSTNCGTLWLDFAATVPYAGTSRTDVYFKAQNKTSGGFVACVGHTNASIALTGVFPAQQSFPFEWQITKRGVVTNIKRNGSINGRILGDGVTRRQYKLVQLNNRLATYNEVEQFWHDHYPHLKWKYVDRLGNFSVFLQFNGEVKVTAQSHQKINYEVETIEVP